MRLILCTAPRDKARVIAATLVEERLVACVNIVPLVESIYRWKGNIETGEEAMMLMKTAADRVGALTARIRNLHPYEVPEIVSLDIHSDEGNADYLSWIRDCVTPTEV